MKKPLLLRYFASYIMHNLQSCTSPPFSPVVTKISFFLSSRCDTSVKVLRCIFVSLGLRAGAGTGQATHLWRQSYPFLLSERCDTSHSSSTFLTLFTAVPGRHSSKQTVVRKFSLRRASSKVFPLLCDTSHQIEPLQGTSRHLCPQKCPSLPCQRVVTLFRAVADVGHATSVKRFQLGDGSHRGEKALSNTPINFLMHCTAVALHLTKEAFCFAFTMCYITFNHVLFDGNYCPLAPTSCWPENQTCYNPSANHNSH